MLSRDDPNPITLLDNGLKMLLIVTIVRFVLSQRLFVIKFTNTKLILFACFAVVSLCFYFSKNERFISIDLWIFLKMSFCLFFNQKKKKNMLYYCMTWYLVIIGTYPAIHILLKDLFLLRIGNIKVLNSNFKN